MLDFSFFFFQQREWKNGNSSSLKINSIQIRHTERIKSNKIEYCVCTNIIDFIAKFQKIVFKNKGFCEPLLFQNML